MGHLRYSPGGEGGRGLRFSRNKTSFGERVGRGGLVWVGLRGAFLEIGDDVCCSQLNCRIGLLSGGGAFLVKQSHFGVFPVGDG